MRYDKILLALHIIAGLEYGPNHWNTFFPTSVCPRLGVGDELRELEDKVKAEACAYVADALAHHDHKSYIAGVR